MADESHETTENEQQKNKVVSTALPFELTALKIREEPVLGEGAPHQL